MAAHQVTPASPFEPDRGIQRGPVIAGAMVTTMAMQIATRLTEASWPDHISWVCLAVTLCLAGRFIGRREAYLLTLCAIVSAAVLLLHPEPARVFAAALNQGAFLMAFILQLGLLYEAAATSSSIAEFGPYLTRQPPGRRYFALFTGTGVLAVLFNAGILSILVPLVQSRDRRGGYAGSHESPRERRRMCAMLRGFAWSIVWSPTALAPLLMAELAPSVDRGLWTVYGLCLFVLILAIGALDDRFRFQRPAVEQAEAVPRFPREAAFGLAAASGALIFIALGATRLTGESLAFGLMVACPVMLVGWTAIQNAGRGSGHPATVRRLAEVIAGLPAALPIAITLTSTGFIGRSAADLLPADVLAGNSVMSGMPEIVLLVLIPPTLALVSWTGISPITMAVFLGSLLGGMNTPPANPTLLAFAISCGWALSMTFAPLSTLALLVNRLSELPLSTLTWRWNLGFSVLAVAGLIPYFTLLSWAHQP